MSNNTSNIIDNYLVKIAGPDLKYLNIDTLSSGGYYLKHTIKKRSGGFRELDAPQTPLINVQTYILNNFLYKFKTHECAHGFVIGRSPKTAAQQHLGAEVLMSFDLKDFFPNINFTRVLRLFRYLIIKDLDKQNSSIGALEEQYNIYNSSTPSPNQTAYGVAYTLANICCLKHSLPQGAPTSPAIANLVAYGLDKRLKMYCDAHNLTYTRYADDISISSTDGGKYHNLEPIKAIIRESGFLVNKKKVRVKRPHQRMSVVGVVVNEKLSVPRWKWRNFKAKLHNYHRDGVVISKKEHERLRGYCEWIMSLHPKRGRKLIQKLGKITVKGN